MELPNGIRHIMPMFGKWEVFYESADKWFHVEEQGYGKVSELSDDQAEDVKQYLELYDRNRMSFFLPHGEGLKALNDWKNEIVLVTAPTRVGKSTIGCNSSIQRVIKCDPEWHCFKYHGIKCPEYRGKRRLVVSSYEWTNVQELWEEYMKWIPRNLVGPYLPTWGKYEDETGKARPIDLKQGKISKIKLTDGTEILFRCDKQAQGPWEGQRWDDGHFDEQRQREKFIGFLRGTSNTTGLTQAIFTLTGHVVGDRPDTGAGGWIKKELFDGMYTFGRNVGRYKLDIPSTPDVIMPREEKARLKLQWVTEPEKNKDIDTLRKAQARYHGGWESGSGLVIENFYPEHHVIPARLVDFRKKVFRDTTLYRGIDHGLSRPCACVWGMVFQWGDLLIYREYFEPSHGIPYHAKHIVEMSGNERKKVDTYKDFDLGTSFDLLEEVHLKEVYAESVLDSRSFGSPSQERESTNMGQLYNDYGLEVTASKGFKNEKLVPLMQAKFDLTPHREHLMSQLYKRGGIDEDSYRVWKKSRHGEIKNAPQIYYTTDLVKTIEETTSWAKSPKNGRPESKNDHIIGGALKYLVACDPIYYGSMWRDKPEQANVGIPWDSDEEMPSVSTGKYTSY